MYTSWKVAAAAVGLLITGTALGTLAVHAQSASPKPDPSKSSYISVNEEDFATVLARMRAAKAGIMNARWTCWARATTSAIAPPPASP